MIRTGPGSLTVAELDDRQLSEHITTLRRECRLLSALLAKHERARTGARQGVDRHDVQVFFEGHQRRLELLRARLEQAEREADRRRQARLAALPAPPRERPSPDW